MVLAKVSQDTSGIWSGCQRTLSGVAGSGTIRCVVVGTGEALLALVKAESRNEPIFSRYSREVIGAMWESEGHYPSPRGYRSLPSLTAPMGLVSPSAAGTPRHHPLNGEERACSGCAAPVSLWLQSPPCQLWHAS